MNPACLAIATGHVPMGEHWAFGLQSLKIHSNPGSKTMLIDTGAMSQMFHAAPPQILNICVW
jgi:hypothetical protein